MRAPPQSKKEMKKFHLILCAFPLVLLLQSLAPPATTFHEHVAEIIYDKCAPCHHGGGIAPFSLTSYSEVYSHQNAVLLAINSDQMPPWPPDTTYQRYAHERVLSPAERFIINEWATSGAVEGNASLGPPSPVFSNDLVLGPADLTLRAPDYVSQATATTDDYVCFSLPTGLTEDKMLQAMELEPGNGTIVHHVLVFVDDSAEFATDTIGGDCVGPWDEGLIGEFTPGGRPTVFPGGPNLKMGMRIPAGSDIVIAMHYAEGSAGMMDSTKVHLHFYDDTLGVRELIVEPVIQLWGFCVNPESSLWASTSFPPGGQGIPDSITAIGVFPHMHLIGHEMEVFSINISSTEFTPIINIPDWDFEWQGMYDFRKPLVFAPSEKFYANALFDNTSANPHNPNSPPDTICSGVNTTDEMFLVFFKYLPYETGDENLDIEALTSLSLEEITEGQQTSPVKVFPNPSSGPVTFSLDLPSASVVQWEIMDLSGRVLRRVEFGKQAQGHWEYEWNGLDSNAQPIAAGPYLYRIRVDQQWYGGKVLWLPRR